MHLENVGSFMLRIHEIGQPAFVSDWEIYLHLNITFIYLA